MELLAAEGARPGRTSPFCRPRGKAGRPRVATRRALAPPRGTFRRFGSGALTQPTSRIAMVVAASPQTNDREFAGMLYPVVNGGAGFRTARRPLVLVVVNVTSYFVSWFWRTSI